MKILKKNGERMVVIRPHDPALAIRLAEEALRENDNEKFQAITQAQDYKFAGYLSESSPGTPPVIVDDHGRVVEAVQKGDSFVSESAIALKN